MNKFNQIDHNKSYTYWGPVYTGHEPIREDPHTELKRSMILSGSMERSSAIRLNSNEIILWRLVTKISN